jgi:biopolymer transport protein ExbD
MAGVDVGGRGGKRALNAEINMIPFIDLLMVTVAFLLITAVWVTNSRLDANALVPGDPGPSPPDPMRTLHLAVGAETYTLTWKDQNVVVSEVTFPKNDADTSRRELKDHIATEWRERGGHKNADDFKTDQLVLHTDNRMPYGEIAAVMDAVAATKREMRVGQSTQMVAAFSTTFSVK